MFADAGAQIAIFCFEPRQLERILDSDQKLFSGKRLLEKIESAQAGSPYGHFDVCLPAHHHYGSCNTGGFQILEEQEAIAARHHHIAQDEVKGLRTGQLECARGIVADHGFVACEPEGACQRSQCIGFVVDDKDVGFRTHGSAFGRVMINVAPPLAGLSTAIVPP